MGMTVIVLGGGASGMAAALAAAERGAQVVLLERQARLGRKLLATGNGRCNLSNLHATPGCYHGKDPDFCRPALERFGVTDTLQWFRGMGLLTVTEPSGRVYPYSDQANSVLDVLRFSLDRMGVRVVAGCEVRKIWTRRDGYLLKTATGDFAGNRLIVAAGGAAGGKLGGTDMGYKLLESLGHRRTELHPALVQLIAEGNASRALKGIRAQAVVEVLDGKTLLARNEGEVQFTETGVSGPAVFEISRAASVGGPGLLLRLDLTPHLERVELTSLLAARRDSFPNLTADDLLTGMLHNRLGRVLVKTAGISAAVPLSELDGPQLARIVETVKAFHLVLAGTQGFDCAQITAGGMVTEDFIPQTLQSRLRPGLYACGEVLDVDGDCGGFNLQWAWSSGRLAGISAASD